MKYNVIISSDHSGFFLKNDIINYLIDKKFSVKDFGTFNPNDIVDYPDYAHFVSEAILEKLSPIGILICSTGIGMSIAANRRSHIRAALCNTVVMAERSRSHNNANVLVLGAKIVDTKLAFDILEKFLSTEFEGGRHITRLSKLH